MRVRFGILIAALFAATATALLAHHSFATEYNIADIVVLKGTLSSFEWANPHAFLTIAVKDESGGTKLGRIEGGPFFFWWAACWGQEPGRVRGGPILFLMESGWRPEMLQEMMKSRDNVVITGYRARKLSDAA